MLTVQTCEVSSGTTEVENNPKVDTEFDGTDRYGRLEEESGPRERSRRRPINAGLQLASCARESSRFLLKSLLHCGIVVVRKGSNIQLCADYVVKYWLLEGAKAANACTQQHTCSGK